ncbi:hypothetical protein ACIA8K_07105 [Catenuloplanes sp. NPDC051500]|uniref:hypothetical protein n=1 Tax=Catenuloplanes sp. NPDC051500 TaxID=3363959 RepID=UPI0037A400B6
MVQLERRRDRDGGDVWVEWAPATDEHGHSPVRPGWGACPVCKWGLRHWACGDHACDGIVHDPEHEHRETPP